MNAAEKKLNEMNRLSDMGHLPASVNAGAALNLLLTVSATYLLVPRYPQPYAPVLWIAVVLTLNLLPVVVLRLTLTPATVYPPLGEMKFFSDQHKFSDWVYVAASANMGFWVLISWTAFSLAHTPAVLVTSLVIAGIATFSPVLVRCRQGSC
jgi:hypothetical protein